MFPILHQPALLCASQLESRCIGASNQISTQFSTETVENLMDMSAGYIDVGGM
ncbi:hypothetical protein DM47_2650 [Burkholderia mallei]|nr:hypothetical protein DM46_2066 [Burkholderia mallei]KOT18802.1 hypothetical protein DM47_2650 [Burkholderia mallei]KOT22413.1 hypothetical protein DM52_2596 [Burkholderia mallei]